MRLSYDGLKAAIEDESLPAALRLRVEPYDPQRLKSASLELYVGSTLARWRQRGQMVVSLAPRPLADINERDFDVTRGMGPGDRFVVAPDEAILLAVDCWVALGAGLCGEVFAKSSIGRAGQTIQTAGWVDPGFVGILTLEPVNHAPIPVVYEVGQPIGQLVLSRLDQPTSRPYGHPALMSRYQGQHEVTPPRPVPSGTVWGAPGTGSGWPG